MSLLETALEIALTAHRDQLDRAGQPYILHPLRVMHRVRGEAEQVVAVLHDVVEDSAWTLEDLRGKGFPEAVVAAVDCLTKREGEPYEALIERARQNRLARRVKLADLEDNMDLRRNLKLGEQDMARLNRYRAAWELLSREDSA